MDFTLKDLKSTWPMDSIRALGLLRLSQSTMDLSFGFNCNRLQNDRFVGEGLLIENVVQEFLKFKP